MLLSNWQDVENYLVEEFKKYSAPFMAFIPENEIDWLVHAQHYGLPTKLLDWTTNPLKAIFFAVEDRKFNDSDGSVFLCSPRSISPDTNNIGLGKSAQFIYSSHINVRIAAQEGAFCVYKLVVGNFERFGELTDDDVNALKKIIVPAACKPVFRAELNKLGINHRTIYPGLEGITKNLIEGFN